MADGVHFSEEEHARKRKWSPLKIILLVLLGALVVIGVSFGMSYSRVRTQVDEALQTYEKYEKYYSEGQLEEAVDSLRSLVGNVREIEKEADSLTWHIACKLPIIGEDVTCLQQVATISDRLASEGLLPVLEKIESIADALDVDNLKEDGITRLLSTSPGQIKEVVEALTQTRTVIKQCKESAEALPTSHFAQINELVETLRTSITKADEGFQKYAWLLDGADIISTLFLS